MTKNILCLFALASLLSSACFAGEINQELTDVQQQFLASNEEKDSESTLSECGCGGKDKDRKVLASQEKDSEENNTLAHHGNESEHENADEIMA